MDIFEYFPQLIVAYDGNDEFANLIHIKKADKEKDYLCPCCGGVVKPRALDSKKEQSHYYHKTGKCTKESQLHFFCKNWLFEHGSKFYINNELFEVESIEIEKRYDTPFGDYIPDVTVHTTIGKDIYFEMFFSNRKTGDNYFCKWNYLGNDVVEVNIKEYMFKTDEDIIPKFSYLYHDGICYSKTYAKRDLYANTIAKIKRELTRQEVLNYKTRIEQLDWFWQKIINNCPKEEILECISAMTYEDMVSCYSIVKRKQCVSYLKNEVLELINQKVVSDVRTSLDLPYDENVYFDLKHIRGRTYEAGIRLNMKTKHISYDDLYIQYSNCDFDKNRGYPKIVFSKNIFTTNEIIIPDEKIPGLKKMFDEMIEYKASVIDYENEIAKFEQDNYKIRMVNNRYTVLSKMNSDNFEVILDNYYIDELSIDALSEEIKHAIKVINNKNFLKKLEKNNEYISIINEVKSINNLYMIDIGLNKYSDELYFKLYFDKHCIYDKTLKPEYNDLLKKIRKVKDVVNNFEYKYALTNKLIAKINNCKNKLWEAKLAFDFGNPYIRIKQKFNSLTYVSRILYISDNECTDEHSLVAKIEEVMRSILNDMEDYGCRVMEVK